MPALAGQNFLRIAVVALGLSTLSFAAGVAGDLTIIDPPRSGQRVVLRIPPEIPVDAVRAVPLPPLLSTASAEASIVAPRFETVSQLQLIEFAHEPELLDSAVAVAVERQEKPQADLVLASAKPNADEPFQANGAKPA